MSFTHIHETEDKMRKTIKNLQEEFNLIRGGRANIALLDRVKVDNYGSVTPLNQVASVSAPEARLIVIQPWDKGVLPAIEKAILAANLGFNPSNDGKVVRINVPSLTEERRKDLVKQAKAEAENHRVALRNIRRDAVESAKRENEGEDDEKKIKEELQKLTDLFIKKVDEIFAAKEKEILEV